MGFNSGFKGLMGTGCQLTGREADHTTPSSAEVKNKWTCPPIRLCGVHR